MASGVRAFVDRPITDLSAATSAANAAANRWDLGAPRLLRLGMNAIFVADGVVLRVGHPSVPATASLELADFLARMGVSTPRPVRHDVVEVGDISVTCWERLVPVDAPVDWGAVGSMVRAVHELDRALLPDTVPLPSPTDFPWWDFDALMERAAPGLDVAARQGLEAVVDRHRGWSSFGGEVVCHGDVHPGNVMMTNDGVVLLDWDLLCWAPPGWDHAPMVTMAERWGADPRDYEAFASGYGRSFANDSPTRSFAELRLVAATLMRVVAGLADPGAMPEAQLRLRYWRGEADAPAWTAQ